MKIFDDHWTIGLSRRDVTTEAGERRHIPSIVIDWDRVRAEGMSADERVLDETEIGNRDLRHRYQEAILKELAKGAEIGGRRVLAVQNDGAWHFEVDGQRSFCAFRFAGGPSLDLLARRLPDVDWKARFRVREDAWALAKELEEKRVDAIEA